MASFMLVLMGLALGVWWSTADPPPARFVRAYVALTRSPPNTVPKGGQRPTRFTTDGGIFGGRLGSLLGAYSQEHSPAVPLVVG